MKAASTLEEGTHTFEQERSAMSAVDCLIGRTFKSKSLVQFIVRTTHQRVHLVAWSELEDRTAYYAAVLGGGVPGAFTWDLDAYARQHA